MSDVPDINNNEMSAILNQIYPDVPTFKKHLMPFFHPVKEEYNSFMKILDKMGVKSIDEYLEILLMNFNISGMIQKEISNLIQKLEKQYGGKFAELSSEKQLEIIGSHISFDNSFPDVTSLQKKDGKVMTPQELDALAGKLPENDDTQYEYFTLFVIKIWISYIVTNYAAIDNALGHFSKELLGQYYTRMNQLFEKDIIPQKLIDYIEGIKVPQFEEIQSETSNKGQAMLAASLTIPVFSEIEKVLEVLKKYFDPSQHDSLLTVFSGNKITNKILFKSNNNQLADAFKRLFNARLIIGCTKAELAQWIEQNFTYKGKGGKATILKEKYLNEIISSDQKICKNPIIEIKTEHGKYLIFSAEKQSRAKS